MRDRRLSNNYASLIFEYCEEHADFTIKQFDASDAIARRGYSQVKFFMTIRKCLLCSFQVFFSYLRSNSYMSIPVRIHRFQNKKSVP